MAKISLSDVASLTNEQSALSTLANNNTLIETAFENTLSRDGTTPNTMGADFDMNSHRILNLPVPVQDTEPARLIDVRDGITGPAGPSSWATPVAWTTSTSYTAVAPASTVIQGGETYLCLISHTSGVFSTDLSAGRWIKIAAKGADGTLAASGTPTANQFGIWNDATSVKGVTITGLVKGNGASAPTAATVGTDYAGPVANPTATIGLTAVNGSATGAMRSDAAPALSQAIAPTWTNLHTFTANIAITNTSGSIEIGAVGSANTPYLDFHSSASSTDYDSRIIASGGTASVGQGTLTFNGASFVFNGVISDTNGAVYSNIPQNSQSAAYTLVLGDANKHIYHPSADTTARTWTIPANASVAFPIGTAITFINDTSGGVITLAITSDTLVLAGSGSTGSRSLAANGVATAIKITSTRWIISGTGLT